MGKSSVHLIMSIFSPFNSFTSPARAGRCSPKKHLAEVVQISKTARRRAASTFRAPWIGRGSHYESYSTTVRRAFVGNLDSRMLTPLLPGAMSEKVGSMPALPSLFLSELQLQRSLFACGDLFWFGGPITPTNSTRRILVVQRRNLGFN